MGIRCRTINSQYLIQYHIEQAILIISVTDITKGITIKNLVMIPQFLYQSNQPLKCFVDLRQMHSCNNKNNQHGYYLLYHNITVSKVLQPLLVFERYKLFEKLLFRIRVYVDVFPIFS